MWLKQIWRCNTKSERSKGRDRNAVRRPRLETRSWVGHERILSIHPNNKADSDQNFHVDVRYHHARGHLQLSASAARPSSAGLATMCWLGKYVVTADSVAGLLLGNVRWTSPALICAMINWRSQHVLRFCSDWWRMPVILWSISTLYLIFNHVHKIFFLGKSD